MAIKTIRQAAGLWDEASTVDVPEGALRLADNVLLHRPGLIVPRWGWRTLISNAGAYRPVMIAPVRDGAETIDQIASTYNGSAYKWEVVAEGTTSTTGATPPGVADSIEMKVAQARGSIYSTSTIGIMKLDAIGNALDRAGVFTDYVMPLTFLALRPVAADTAYALGTQKSAAYRYVWVRTDSNSYERLSPASQRGVVDNTNATYPAVVTFDRIKFALGIVEGDRIEFYRTIGVTNGGVAGAGVPTEEYFLAFTYQVTAADVANQYINVNSLVDSTPDDQLGATLYVSPSQGGETANSKEPPPIFRDIALWQDVMWGAHMSERATLSLEFVHARLSSSASPADRSRDHLGWGYLSGSCGFTNGSAVVTIAAAAPYTARVVTGSCTGQYIYDSTHPETAGTRVPASTTITAIRTKITIDNAKLNSAGSPDSIVLGDVRFTWDGGGTTPSVTKGATSTDSATNLAAAINAYPWKTGVNSVIDGNAHWSLTATSALAVVTIVDVGGFGVHGADITLANAGNVDGMIPSYEYTMSANATNTSSATTIRTDFLTINAGSGAIKFYASEESYYSFYNDTSLYAANDRGLNSNSGYDSSKLNRRTCVENATNAAAGINAYQVNNRSTFGVAAIASDTSVLLIGATPDESQIEVTASKPDAFRPRIPSGGLRNADRLHPGRLAWSLPSEPEAWPSLSYADIGDPDKPIERIIALRDALLVWKRDGLYRVTGAPPDQWRVDPLDTTVWLVHPECVTVLENTCYAWTNRGVIAVNEGGLGDVISMPIASELRRVAALLPRSGDGTSINRGFCMTVHERNRQVLLAMNNSAIEGEDFASITYIYSLTTGAWSSTSRAHRCLAWDPNLGLLLESSGYDEWRINKEYVDDGTGSLAWLSDWQQTGLTLGSTIGSTTYTLTNAQITPRSVTVGDVFLIGGTYARCSATASQGGTTTMTLDRVGDGITSADWYSVIDCQVQWHAQTAGSAAMGTHWQEAVLQLDSSDSAPTTWPLEIGGSSHIQAIGSYETVTATITSASEPIAKPVRVGLPRNIGRSPLLWPYLRIRTALVRWAASTLSLVARSTGTRVTR